MFLDPLGTMATTTFHLSQTKMGKKKNNKEEEKGQPLICDQTVLGSLPFFKAFDFRRKKKNVDSRIRTCAGKAQQISSLSP